MKIGTEVIFEGFPDKRFRIIGGPWGAKDNQYYEIRRIDDGKPHQILQAYAFRLTECVTVFKPEDVDVHSERFKPRELEELLLSVETRLKALELHDKKRLELGYGSDYVRRDIALLKKLKTKLKRLT